MKQQNNLAQHKERKILENIFKAYDIRGKFPEELNEKLAYSIGRSYAELFCAKKVAVGYDVRLSSPILAKSLTKGLRESGCDVVDIGLCGTEQIYFAVFHLKLDGGIMITASHNPKDYNGMKLVAANAKPISGNSGLNELKKRVVLDKFKKEVTHSGKYSKIDITDEYVKHLLSYIDVSKLKPLKIVVDSGNGCAGRIIDALEPYLPFEFIKLNHKPDGTFPNGVPNPLLPENRSATAEAVIKEKANLGIAWDGDFDRCFFFDEKGQFVESYYIVGFLAHIFLKRYSNSKIIHDPRLVWNTVEIVKEAGGIPVQSKTGHAFIKERMRIEDAVYGGEMSGHHYFRDFSYCDSGMIPWLLMSEIISKENKKLSELIDERIKKYPTSGEINFKVSDPDRALKYIKQHFIQENPDIDYTDGMSMEFKHWRFNLRKSNTEPLIRLNVETKGDRELLDLKTKEISDLIYKFKG